MNRCVVKFYIHCGGGRTRRYIFTIRGTDVNTPCALHIAVEKYKKSIVKNDYIPIELFNAITAENLSYPYDKIKYYTTHEIKNIFYDHNLNKMYKSDYFNNVVNKSRVAYKRDWYAM